MSPATRPAVSAPAEEEVSIATRPAPALSLAQRHGLAAGGRVVLDSDFAEGMDLGPGGWRVIGEPTIDRVAQGGESGVLFAPPAEGFHVCRMEHDIAADELDGKDVRLRLRLLHRSAESVAALGSVKLSVMVAPVSGAAYTLPLPIVAGVAPGWEDHVFDLRLVVPVRSASLRIDLADAEARIRLTRIVMVARRAPGVSSAEAVSNVIPDGSFEAGQPRFFASGRQWWPHGEPRDVTLPWSFASDAAVGARSLSVPLAGVSGRVGWSPIDLSSDSPDGDGSVTKWHLRFRARADQPVTLTAKVATATRVLTEDEFTLSDEWSDYTHAFTIDAATLDDPVALARASLLFDLAPGEGVSSAKCRIDHVRLTNVPFDTEQRGAPSVEIGIVTGRQLPTDLSNLWQVGEEATLVMRLVGGTERAGASAGTLVIDVVDAYGESVATRVSAPVFGADGTVEQPLTLDLSRGAYRVMATLWASDVGESRRLAHTTLPIAVIRMDDPVPSRNRFGLRASGMTVSRRTTHLGAGWVRVDWRPGLTETRRGYWDFAPWQTLTEQCEAASVELLPRVLLPGEPSLCQAYVEQWLAQCPDGLIAVSIPEPPIAGDAATVYAQQVEVVRTARGSGCADVVTVLDRSMVTRETELAADEAVGVSCEAGVLPEDAEATLSVLKRYVGPVGPMWDLTVPVKTAGWPSEAPLDEAEPMFKIEPGPVRQLATPVPPAVSASRLARAMLVRLPAGMAMTCCSASALRPVRQPRAGDEPCLHESDFSPRPELVAFDWMAELLNDATFVRESKRRDGVRLMLFRKDDGRAVLAAWRPFGQSRSRMTLEIPREEVAVFDCFGKAIPFEIDGSRTVMAVNEIVQYLVCPAERIAALERSLEDGDE